jgi:hypothetical protein
MKRNYLYLYSASIVLFLALIAILCVHFRISTDDFYHMSYVEKNGVLRLISYSYLKWSGRFATFGMIGLMFKLLLNHPDYFFLVPLFSLLLLVTGVYLLLQQLADLYAFRMDGWMKFILSLSFTLLLFFMSFDIGETWFWCSGIAAYLLNIVACIWGLFFILRQKTTWLNRAAIVICFVFVGGSMEVYALFFLLMLLGFSIYRFKKHPVHFLKNELDQQLILAQVFLAIGFLTLVIAPGNYMRDQLFPEHNVWLSFFIAAKSLAKFFIFYLPSHVHYLIAFTFPFFFAGKQFRSFHDVFSTRFFSFVKRVSLYFIAFLLVFSYLLAFIMCETGPARLWFLVSFFFSVYTCAISFYAGYCGVFSLRWEQVVQLLSGTLAFLVLAYSVIQQSNLASRYSASFDEREKILREFNRRGIRDTVLVLPSLPPAGMLYPAEISNDPGHYKNQHLSEGYKLIFRVIEN